MKVITPKYIPLSMWHAFARAVGRQFADSPVLRELARLEAKREGKK